MHSIDRGSVASRSFRECIAFVVRIMIPASAELADKLDNMLQWNGCIQESTVVSSLNSLIKLGKIFMVSNSSSFIRLQQSIRMAAPLWLRFLLINITFDATDGQNMRHLTTCLLSSNILNEVVLPKHSVSLGVILSICFPLFWSFYEILAFLHVCFSNIRLTFLWISPSGDELKLLSVCS